MFAILKPKRSWLQYRLRTLLLFTALCGVAARWVLVPVEAARRQESAARAIADLKGQCYHCRGKPLVPKWANGIFGLEYGISVSHASFPKTTGDAELALLDDLPNLLDLMQCGSRVTDAGLRHVAQLTEIRVVNLSDSQVTDAGLEQLRGLSNLRNLDVSDTHVTDEGAASLQLALPNCHIVVGRPDRQ